MNVKPARSWRRKVLLLALLLVLLITVANRHVLAWLPHYQASHRIAADRLDEARWWIDVARRVGGDSPETMFYRSRLARKAGDIEQAQQFLNDAEESGLAADRVAREQILIRAQSGDIQDAQTVLPLLLQGSPSDAPEVCEAFALGFRKTHASMETAVGLLNAWVVDYEDDPRPHLLLAEFSLEAMDVDNAMQELRRALKINPNYGRAALALGELTLQQQEPDEAMKLFQTAALTKAIRLDALIWQSRCLRTVGRTVEAQSILEQALEEAPDSTRGNIEQAHLEIAARDFPAVIKRLRAVLDREPYRHEARSALATALRSVGQLDEAREQLAIATAANSALVRARHLARDVAVDPTNVELRAEIGQIHLKHGDPQTARQWLHSVLMFDPQHQPTRKTLDDFYESHPAASRARVAD